MLKKLYLNKIMLLLQSIFVIKEESRHEKNI